MSFPFRIHLRRLARATFILIGVSAAFAQGLEWNWRESRELTGKDSLREAPIPERDRQRLRNAIVGQLENIGVDDPGPTSKEQSKRAALDTRVAMIDLNGDGTPEVVAQGVSDCSPTGNCSLWIFQKTSSGYKVILNGFGQTFTTQPNRVNGYLDVVIGAHSSATEQGLTVYSYKGGRYHETGCFDANWNVSEGETLRKLKEPRITRITCGML